jgi:mannose-1-phosphate guanylyltransferase
MKAFLLTAGLGTRLRPLTDHTPKCLLPIAGRPLLDYWFDLFEKYGIDDVLVNTHHLPEQTEKYLINKEFQGNIHIAYEPELLGSAGTIRANRDFVANEDLFFVFYGDNLANIRIDRWLSFHRGHGGDLSLLLYHTDKPHLKGILELDDRGLILSFEEKPSQPKSNLASAGMYLASPIIFDVFPDSDPPIDMAFHVLPKLIGRMWGMPCDDLIIDIGTPQDYQLAQQKALELRTEGNETWS